MSKHHQFQFFCSLEAVINTFNRLEEAIAKSDSEWITKRISSIWLDCHIARYHLSKWEAEDTESEIEEQELERLEQDYQPDIYDPVTHDLIIY